MGSGFDRLAPITGPAKNNRQANVIRDQVRRTRAGARSGLRALQARSNPIASGLSTPQSHRTASSGSQIPQGRPAAADFSAESPSGRTSAPAFEVLPSWPTAMDHKSNQANRAISTGQLNASPRLHIRPINVVVFHGSQGSSRFKGGFPLRCLQRLSRPYIAMLHCGWRHNSSTRGTSIPVLSY